MITSALSTELAANPISIASIYSASFEEWDAIWRDCDYSTFFHSREWAEIWQRSTGEDIHLVPEIVLFSDQKKALLPLVYRKRAKGLLNTYTTSMEGTFGGWISTDTLQAEHAALLTNHLLKRVTSNLSWRMNPYDPSLSKIQNAIENKCLSINWAASKSAKFWQSLANFNRPILIPDDTHAINLEPGFSGLFKSQSSIVRKAKKAQKAGVEITFAETVEDWNEYYQVYQSSVERWRKDPSTAYSWELFKDIFEHRSPRVKLWIARYDNKIVSGALCFYSKKHVVYWHGSSLKEYFELRPVNLLMLEIIKDACERGYAWYDFNPSGHMQGVITFKESFGAKPLSCPVIYVDNPIKRIARALLLGTRGYF